MALSVIASYGHSATCKDKRESYPVSLALVVAFEGCVCDASTAPCMAFLLGALLLCVQGSMRFGDALISAVCKTAKAAPKAAASLHCQGTAVYCTDHMLHTFAHCLIVFSRGPNPKL